MQRLFIDLDICSQCAQCTACCDYLAIPQNKGVTSVREYGAFALFCRKCEDAPCVTSCYHDALERQSDGILRRYRMRCTSCKSCTIACPFGTIFPEVIPYLDSRCDFCIQSDNAAPRCVSSCPEKAVSVVNMESEDLENDIYFIGEHLAVRSRKWTREDVQKPKRK